MLKSKFYFFSRRVYCSVSVNINSEIQNAKPYSEIPTISFFKIVKESLPGGKYYKKNIMDTTKAFYDEFGSIYKVPGIFTSPEIVMTYDAENFEKVFRAEGAWPDRFGPQSVLYYRNKKRPEIYKDIGSLFVSSGEKWHNIRTLVNPILMKPKVMKRYMTQVDVVAKEYIEVMKKIRNENGEMPGDFFDWTNKWSLESVLTVALEHRLNLFDENTNDENAQKLIQGVKDLFHMIAEYDAKPSIYKYYETRGFKKLLAIYDNLTDAILNYIDIAIKEMNEEKTTGDLEESIIRQLLRIDKKVAVSVASDMLFAGVDTTSVAIMNTLYCLAKNPDKQEILREEVFKIMPEKNSRLTPEMTKNMPYLRAVRKEALRLFPIVSANSRRIAKDIVISGYHIPANTHVAMQTYHDLKNEKYFPNPEEFIPERWVRGNSGYKSGVTNPYVFLPFGHGPRTCIGRRIGEMEMESLLLNIIRNFKVEWHYPDMEIRYNLVNLPDSEMKFKIIDV